MKRMFVLMALAIVGAKGLGAPVMTRFDPKIHGFQFANMFSDDQIDIIDKRTDGFCAGMSHNALDYFKANMPVPKGWWLPSRGTPLERQILARHKQANLMALDRMIELELNPGGERDTEFYEWGISSRIPELRASIDAGNPIPVILRGDGNGHHEVLAIGYDMGRYAGNKTGPVTDFTIFAYDPNQPGEVTQIKPNPPGRNFLYAAPASAKNSGLKWRTWFCNTRYKFTRPANLEQHNFPATGKTAGVVLSFNTGADDLRGGKDGGDSYIDLKVTMTNGTSSTMMRASLGQRWIANDGQEVFFPLSDSPLPGSVASVEVTHVTNGGLSPDNWTMKSLVVREVGKAVNGSLIDDRIINYGQHRFDGRNRKLTVFSNAKVPSDKAATLVCTFRTDGDDLRGGSNNLGVVVKFSNGMSEKFDAVNQRIQWTDYSTNTIRLNLAAPRNPIEIVSLEFALGNDGKLSTSPDNWTMGMVEVKAVLGSEERLIGFWGQNRFTAERPRLLVPLQTRDSANTSNLLHLVFNTGGDDLRGGNDNLKVKVNLRSGRSEEFVYVNQGVQWNNNRRSDVMLKLSNAIRKEDILSIELEIDRGGDNWSMASSEGYLWSAGRPIEVYRQGAARFSGSNPKLVIRPN
jgi:hypothetical protein